MKYIKLFEDIDFDDIVEEEFDDDNKKILTNQPVEYYEQFIGRFFVLNDNSVYINQQKYDKNGHKQLGKIVGIDSFYYDINENIKDNDFIFKSSWTYPYDDYEYFYCIKDIKLI